jgi:Bax protein
MEHHARLARPRSGVKAMVLLPLALAALVGGAIAVRPLQVASAHVADAYALTTLMDGIDYRIAPLGQPESRVPRLVLQRLPDGMAALDVERDRKRTFLRALLPLILSVNEAILKDREDLIALRDALDGGETLDDDGMDRLRRLAQAYRLAAPTEATLREAVEALLLRVDIVPPSLALAQGAVESGWGTSRFALEGNALFGQSAWGEDGMAPLGHQEPPFHVASFPSLRDCVAAYAANLNSHTAYTGFRTLRAQQREAGQQPDGRALAATLLAYAETGAVYTGTLRSVIDSNGLAMFDHVLLDEGRTLIVMASR